MKFVEPIRDMKKVSQIKNILKWSNKIRDLLLFELWINSALRISDLLNIKTKDLFDGNGDINDFFKIKEEKTNKVNKITITPKVKETLKLYKEMYGYILKDDNCYIFFHSKKTPLWIDGIWRKQAWKMINGRCVDVWLKWNYGWHTLRKTWGYQARQQAIPLEIIQHKLNHSSLAITQRYLGITDDEIAEACNKLDL
jgi:integrase